MPQDAWKVGDLAERTGLTVRSLHHYDEIGLLRPSGRTAAGHRLYTASDLARLQQVVSLRQLGFTLDEIGDCLDRPDYDPVDVIRRHAGRLREQMSGLRALCDRLDGLATQLGAAGAVSAELFLNLIGMMTVIENYYTPEQLETLKQRRESMGDQAVQQGTNDWATLIADFGAALERGVDPADPQLRPLVERRQALLDAFTGGNPGIAASLKKMWEEKGEQFNAQYGYDPKVMEYMAKAAGAK